MTIHEFTPPPTGATLHAIDGGVRYLRVDWIMRQELGGSPVYYCPTEEWATTPAGRLAVKDAEIAALHAHIAELEQRLADAVVPPAVADAATGMEPSAPSDDAGGGRRKAPPAKEPCPECNKLISPWQMENHKRQAHSAPSRSLTVPPWPPAQLVEDLGDWRCAVCGGTSHTRSLLHPDRCLRCAASAPANGNGVEAAK